jgi:NAD-dependent SIR2 family protein deacetylase
VLVTSGSGFPVDSGMPFWRGTSGLWKQYPAFKRKKIRFDDLVNVNFFNENPYEFWYAFGHQYNAYKEGEPHSGYRDLHDILDYAKPNRNWFVYHEGIDDFYEKAGTLIIPQSYSLLIDFPRDQIMQGKGSVFNWQCKPCWKLVEYKGILNS